MKEEGKPCRWRKDSNETLRRKGKANTQEGGALTLKQEKLTLQGGALALQGSKLKEVEILSGKRLLIYFQFLSISLLFIQTR